MSSATAEWVVLKAEERKELKRRNQKTPAVKGRKAHPGGYDDDQVARHARHARHLVMLTNP